MKKLKQLPLILSILTISLTAAYLASAWTEPGVAPPGSNIDAPLNTSINAQAKEGALVIGANEAVEIGLAIQHGKVGIGVSEPKSALDIVGEAKLSSSGDACSADNEGAMRYLDSDQCLYLCNGTDWTILYRSGSYTLTIADDGNGTATDVTGSSPYEDQDRVNISASPNSGYEFSHWTAPAGSFDDASSSVTVFTMPGQNVTVTANFTEIDACEGEHTLTYGGQTYSLVGIGDQCWLGENLNVTNGNTDRGCWITRCCFGDVLSNCELYGGLYAWDDAMCEGTTEGVQGICPNGWHIPTDNDFKVLEIFLGMSQAEADAEGVRGVVEEVGLNLRANYYWLRGGGDPVRFSAVPGERGRLYEGYKVVSSYQHDPDDGRETSTLLTSSSAGDNIYVRMLSCVDNAPWDVDKYGITRVQRDGEWKNGYVRCIKDN